MSESISADMPAAVRVAAGADHEGCQRGLGISTIAFKVTVPNPSGLFILENTFLAKGGPVRHLHYDQEEWFSILEGEFQFEVGAERLRLHPGDSLLAPRQVPHVWAFVGDARGRILIAFLPAGKMEAFFREVTKANAMPPKIRGYGVPMAWSCWDRLCQSSKGWGNDSHVARVGPYGISHTFSPSDA